MPVYISLQKYTHTQTHTYRAVVWAVSQYGVRDENPWIEWQLVDRIWHTTTLPLRLQEAQCSSQNYTLLLLCIFAFCCLFLFSSWGFLLTVFPSSNPFCLLPKYIYWLKTFISIQRQWLSKHRWDDIQLTIIAMTTHTNTLIQDIYLLILENKQHLDSIYVYIEYIMPNNPSKSA